MLKLLGAVFILTAWGWWGAGRVKKLCRHRDVLEGLRSGIAFLEEEMTFRLAPLPELLEQLGERDKDPAGEFFRQCLTGLRQDPESGLRQSWRRAMTRCLQPLAEEERQELMEVGRVLGQYDAQTQRQVLLHAEKALCAFRDRAAGEVGRMGRVYTALSLASGALMVLILW